MQSQQKKVKWSRGETSEALEERTDTGITGVSVSRMVNCMPDIYGNISRRPGLKLLPTSTSSSNLWYFASANYTISPEDIEIFNFNIAKDDCIALVCIKAKDQYNTGVRNVSLYGYRIKNGSIVRVQQINTVDVSGDSNIQCSTQDADISFAQQNNYAILGTSQNVWKLQLTAYTDTSFTMSVNQWYFAGGWYAPNGTATKTVTSSSDLSFKFFDFENQVNATTFGNYAYNDPQSQTSTVFSYCDSGCWFKYLRAFVETFPRGSLIKMPNLGCYFRLEGYVLTAVISSTIHASNVYFEEYDLQAITATTATVYPYLKVHVEANKVYLDVVEDTGTVARLIKDYDSAASVLAQVAISGTAGYSIYSDGTFNALADSGSNHVGVYGSLLTPLADGSKNDTIVTVDTGYVDLTPSRTHLYNDSIFPHPSKFTFHQQRLFAGGWKPSFDKDYSGLVIGSQIGKYTDLKNDYNYETEALTIDILTKSQEKVFHVVDYNGLKIFTDESEYSYTQSGGVVKQSSNGTLSYCEPIVFKSLLLYADETGHQIRAMQYEHQTDIYESSVINNLAPKDLVFKPIKMAQYEDGEENTGTFLFVLNTYDTDYPQLAVVNYVPGNQAAIWSRWNAWVGTAVSYTNPGLMGVTTISDKPMFLVRVGKKVLTTPEYTALTFATLDYEAEADLLTSVSNTDTIFKLSAVDSSSGGSYFSMPNATVNVYDDGVFQWTDTLSSTGAFTRSLSTLTNPSVGLPINAEIVSHPIDVGGKTKTIVKRIGKAVLSVRNTDENAIAINSKTGYYNSVNDTISYYNVSGNKIITTYTISNINGAKFTIESLTMNIEYGTLNS